MAVLLVAVGAAVGAPARYLADRWITSRHESLLPWGTLTVNVLGSFLFGLLVGGARAHQISQPTLLLLGAGFCGALTTFSTFGYECVRLVESGAWRVAATNVAASLGGGLVAASAGWGLASLLW